MRGFVLPLLLAVSLGASLPAMAADMGKPATPPAKPAVTAPAKPVTPPAKPASYIQTTAGIIKTLDTKACTITLTNKDVFYVRGGKCEAFSKLKVGEKVKLSWYARNGRDWATRVTTA
jgi:hypothetical protein